MNIIYFAAGLLTASIIAYVWIRVNKKFNQLQEDIDHTRRDVNKKFNQLQEDIDHTRRDIYQYHDLQERNMDNRIDDIYQVLSEIERRFETPKKQQLNG
jgi:outer membrane murein-binding lipoprotein Lpp